MGCDTKNMHLLTFDKTLDALFWSLFGNFGW